MSPSRQIASTTRLIHDAFVLWARDLLQEAGLDSVEVYGQFPPEGTVAHHVVLFPYALGPDPKLLQTAPGAALAGLANRLGEEQDRVPEAWLAAAVELERVGRLLGGGEPTVPLRSLPPALADWYREAPRAEERWVSGEGETCRARLPLLWWRPGLILGVRYVAIAADVGRGGFERTSTGAPMSLPALSVLAGGLHHRRTVQVSVPPTPVPEGLRSWAEAVPAHLRGALAERIDALSQERQVEVALSPAQDLSIQEFALMMQALQRTLQAALNVQLRYRLADVVALMPATALSARTRGAARSK